MNRFTKIAIPLFLAIATNSQAGTVYNAADDFEVGFVNHTNPDSVWSYGSSSGFLGPVTLYTETVQNGVNGNAQFWLLPSAIGDSPRSLSEIDSAVFGGISARTFSSTNVSAFAILGL
jgi:hypothetical protein